MTPVALVQAEVMRTATAGHRRGGRERGRRVVPRTAAAPDQYPKVKQRMDTESLRRTVAWLDAGSPSKSSDRSSVSRPSRSPVPRGTRHRGGRERTAGAGLRCGVRRRGVEAVLPGIPAGRRRDRRARGLTNGGALRPLRRPAGAAGKDGPPTPGRLGCATMAVSPGGEPPTTRVGSRSTSRPCELADGLRAGYAWVVEGMEETTEPPGLRACAPGPVRWWTCSWSPTWATWRPVCPRPRRRSGATGRVASTVSTSSTHCTRECSGDQPRRG